MNAMQPPQSIEEIKAGLETTEKGGVRQSIRNCLTVFQRDPLLSGAIAYNILTDRKDIIKPIADDDSIEVGDYVIVPAGKDNHEAVVEVVNKEYFAADEVPLPTEKTKHIIRKCTEDDFDLPKE